jgi:hypothetical protein
VPENEDPVLRLLAMKDGTHFMMLWPTTVLNYQPLLLSPRPQPDLNSLSAVEKKDILIPRLTIDEKPSGFCSLCDTLEWMCWLPSKYDRGGLSGVVRDPRTTVLPSSGETSMERPDWWGDSPDLIRTGGTPFPCSLLDSWVLGKADRWQVSIGSLGLGS